MMRRFLLVILLTLSVGHAAAREPGMKNTVAEKPPAQFVTVVIPFLEIHTGPEDSYPVTQVIERGEKVEVLKIRTGWYKVRGPRGNEGWVSAEKLKEATGSPVE
jgi:uncharacterized protein YgiM (DUF1202 family)